MHTWDTLQRTHTRGRMSCVHHRAMGTINVTKRTNMSFKTVIKYKKNRETIVLSATKAVRRDRTSIVETEHYKAGMTEAREFMEARR